MEEESKTKFSMNVEFSFAVICFWVPGIDLHISTSFLLRIEGTKIIKDMEEESKTKFSMNVEFSFAFKKNWKRHAGRGNFIFRHSPKSVGTNEPVCRECEIDGVKCKKFTYACRKKHEHVRRCNPE